MILIDICESSASSRVPLFTNLLSKHTPTLGYIPQRLRGTFQEMGCQHPAVRPGGGVQEVGAWGWGEQRGRGFPLPRDSQSQTRSVTGAQESLKLPLPSPTEFHCPMDPWGKKERSNSVA